MSSIGAHHDAPSAELVQEFLSGKLTQIDVVSLERELKELWASATTGASEEQRRAVGRACVLNLILYTSDPDAETSAANLLDEITLRHPCRAILAIARFGRDINLEAWVSARCHLPSSGSSKQICCEQITVRCEGKGTQELPSVVIPLLVADLPVFLWWRTGSFDYRALEPFLSSTDRLVIDSNMWDSGHRFFPELNNCIQNRGNDLVVSDLNWSRTTPWRRLLARVFDDPAAGLSVMDLEAIEGAEILYTVPSATQSILLLSWLAAQLGWQPVSARTVSVTTTDFAFKKNGKTISGHCKSQPPDSVPDGQITAVNLKLTGSTAVHCRLEMKDRVAHLVAEISTGAHEKRLVMAGPDFDEARLFGSELDVQERDRVYQAAIVMASEITGCC